jgi:hypothetical protein
MLELPLRQPDLNQYGAWFNDLQNTSTEHSMADKDFTGYTLFREFRSRAGFVGVIAVTNPLLLTAYVLYGRPGVGALDFWLIGMALTVLVCAISSVFMLLVVIAERRRRFAAERKAAMWADVMPYDANKAKATKAAKAG